MAQRPYIVGNWKMHGTRAMLAEARAIDRAAERLIKAEVAIAPPYTLIHAIRKEASLIGVGAQDCHQAEGGAHTGDVSAAMLKDAGAGFVIVGHSERRADHGETNEVVKAKASSALHAGLQVILCVGESEADRDAGKAEEVVAAQIAASLPDGTEYAEKMTIAYEPVWAIGTGQVASVEQVSEAHELLRRALREWKPIAGGEMPILYGGSVKPDNAEALSRIQDVNGFLIGGASLKVEDFLKIYRASADN